MSLGEVSIIEVLLVLVDTVYSPQSSPSRVNS